MKIKSLRFVIGAARPGQFPDLNWSEVAIAGRSNVGKSSLINMLFSQRSFVRVSSTPGRTRQINFFAVNESFHLVDLPGYGFAKAPKALRRSWQHLMATYLERRPQLTAAVLLLDVRRLPSEEDFAVLELFRERQTPVMLALTKADKLPLQRRGKQVSSVAGQLGLTPGDVHVTSATKGWGRDALWKAIECFLTPIETTTVDEGD